MVLLVNLIRLPSEFNLIVNTRITSNFDFLRNLGLMVRITRLTRKFFFIRIIQPGTNNTYIEMG